jgi:hypothetical protein
LLIARTTPSHGVAYARGPVLHDGHDSPLCVQMFRL